METIPASRRTCSVIIATLERPSSLREVLRCLSFQTRLPDQVLVSAAGDIAATDSIVGEFCNLLPIELISNSVRSSAIQRNNAADLAEGEVLAFMDDDIAFRSDLLELVMAYFEGKYSPAVLAVSPRIGNTPGHKPSNLVRLYYALVGGYLHTDYAGHLFGPGINCFPIFHPSSDAPQRASWLPSTCLFVEQAAFRRHRFPPFTEYSFAEDVYLTGKLAKDGRLLFLARPSIEHFSGESDFKRNVSTLASHKLHNMSIIAREVLGYSGWSLRWRWELHRIFMVCVTLITRKGQWKQEIVGFFRARMSKNDKS